MSLTRAFPGSVGRAFGSRGGASIPKDIKSLIVAVNGSLKTLAGPTALYSAAAGQVPDGLGGVQASTSAPVHLAGYYGGPAYTNKCTCKKASPTDLTNLSQGGDPAATLAVVSDSAKITTAVAAGLTELSACSGNVYKSDNSAGVAVSDISISGPAGNLNIHTLSVYVRGGTCRLFGGSSADGYYDFAGSADYTRISAKITPSTTGRVLVVRVNPGQVVYFIMPQLAESSYLLPTVSNDNAADVSVVSTVGTTTGNGVSVPLTGSDAAERLIECFRGVPDGVEIWSNATASGTNWANVGGVWTHTTGSTVALTDAGKVVIGQRYKATYVVARTAGSVVAKAGSTGTGGATIAAAGTYTEELTCAGSTDMAFVPSSDFAGSVTVTSIQKLSPAVGTVAVLMKMGVGSAEITADSTVWGNILSIRGVTVDLLYSSREVGAYYYASADGSGPSYRGISSWARGEYHLRVVEFNGTKYRVGNQRYSENGTAIDADIVWSHATLAGGANFDGSFNPTTFLRWFLNSTVPNWMKAHFVSNQVGLGDAEIIRRLRKYGKF